MVKNRLNIAVIFDKEEHNLKKLEGKEGSYPTPMFGTEFKITARALSKINIIRRA
jgi:hypothetical protein